MTDRELTGGEAQRALSEAMRRTRATVPDPTPAELIAKAIAWDEAGNEANGYASWENCHSCGMGRYGCCGGGKDIDRAVLAKSIEEALLTVLEGDDKTKKTLRASHRLALQVGQDLREVRNRKASSDEGPLSNLRPVSGRVRAHGRLPSVLRAPRG